MKLFFVLTILILLTCLIQAKSFEDYVKQGDACYVKFDLEQAYTYYKKAYEIKPKDYYVLLKITRISNDLGEYYKELHKRDLAEKEITRAVTDAELFYSLFPDSAKVYTYLAWSYGNLAMFEGGKGKIKLANKIRDNGMKAIRMDSTDYLPYIILGIYNRQIGSLNWFEKLFANTFFGDVPEGSVEESLRLFNKALGIQSDMIVAYYQLSRAYREMNETKKEIEMLKKVMELQKQDFRDDFSKEKSEIRLKELLN